MKRLLLTCILIMLALLPATALADVTPVGDLEFNNLDPITNYFTVSNFTGASSYPVLTPVEFDSVILKATESNGTVLTFSLLNPIAAGTADISAHVDSSILFTQVYLTATLNPSTFTLSADGSTFVADPTLLFTLTPSSGTSLVAFTDFGTIYATGHSLSATPEPSTLSLFVFGLLGMLGLRARKYLDVNRS